MENPELGLKIMGWEQASSGYAAVSATENTREANLDALVADSVIGPIGLPADEAEYPRITTADGKPMNAMNDYVIRMTKEQLPPAKASWSVTLYDLRNKFAAPDSGGEQWDNERTQDHDGWSGWVTSCPLWSATTEKRCWNGSSPAPVGESTIMS